MADSVNEGTFDSQDIRQKALDQLNALGLNWTITEHEAVYTIAEMDRLGLPAGGAVCKNFFYGIIRERNIICWFCRRINEPISRRLPCCWAARR